MKQPDYDRMYIGSAGESYVMAEFLARGYNVAVPRVDLGDDVLVIKDDQHKISRVQVKTARQGGKGGSQFGGVSHVKMETVEDVLLWFVFLVRGGASLDHWLPPVLMEQRDLTAIYAETAKPPKPGRAPPETLTFKITFSEDGSQARRGKVDLSKYLNDWSAWPSLLSTGKSARASKSKSART